MIHGRRLPRTAACDRRKRAFALAAHSAVRASLSRACLLCLLCFLCFLCLGFVRVFRGCGRRRDRRVLEPHAGQIRNRDLVVARPAGRPSADDRAQFDDVVLIDQSVAQRMAQFTEGRALR